MRHFMKEFKEFICRGNVMDMAVGIIIGSAFTGIVSSLVEDIINPVLGLFGGMNFDKLQWNLTEEIILYYGRFLTAVLNFLIMAFVIFMMVKAMNKAAAFAVKKAKEEPAVLTKTCPYCRTEISLEAVRCPHCTSTLDTNIEESRG